MGKENFIVRSKTPAGENRTEKCDEEGRVLWRVTGEGEETRGIISHGELIPGSDQVLFGSKTASPKARELLRKEMEEEGAKTLGQDSPDLGAPGKSHHGWSRGYGQNFDQAFGRN